MNLPVNHGQPVNGVGAVVELLVGKSTIDESGSCPNPLSGLVDALEHFIFCLANNFCTSAKFSLNEADVVA